MSSVPSAFVQDMKQDKENVQNVMQPLELQGGVTYILTVGRSATGVKLKVNGQGLQKLSSHR